MGTKCLGRHWGGLTGGAAGAAAGGELGAKAGSVVPGKGTVVGGISGGIVGFVGGAITGGMLAGGDVEATYRSTWEVKCVCFDFFGLKLWGILPERKAGPVRNSDGDLYWKE